MYETTTQYSVCSHCCLGLSLGAPLVHSPCLSYVMYSGSVCFCTIRMVHKIIIHCKDTIFRVFPLFCTSLKLVFELLYVQFLPTCCRSAHLKLAHAHNQLLRARISVNYKFTEVACCHGWNRGEEGHHTCTGQLREGGMLPRSTLLYIYRTKLTCVSVYVWCAVSFSNGQVRTTGSSSHQPKFSLYHKEGSTSKKRKIMVGLWYGRYL